MNEQFPEYSGEVDYLCKVDRDEWSKHSSDTLPSKCRVHWCPCPWCQMQFSCALWRTTLPCHYLSGPSLLRSRWSALLTRLLKSSFAPRKYVRMIRVIEDRDIKQGQILTLNQSINHILFANMKNYIQQFC